MHCTIVQFALVDVFAATCIGFNVNDGNLSGVIAAAYAAGKISIRYAIAIAHHREVVVNIATGLNK
jgi:hypothetical protein